MTDGRWLAGGALLLIVPTACVGPPPPPVSVAPASAPIAERAPPRPALPPARFTLEGVASQGGVMTGQAPIGTRALTLDGVAASVAPDGRFLIAFDRDAPASVRLEALRTDGSRHVETIAVAPREWRIERLNRVARFSQPSAEFQRRRPPELAAIAAARARDTGANGWRQRFIWPATGRVSGLFGAQRVYRGEPGAYHSGVDVAKPAGAAIVAPADGVIVLAAASPFTLEGNVLMIDHGMGLNSAFLHLSRIDVREGQSVRQGETLGAVGATGRASGPHLHWGMKWHESRIDPLLLAGPMPAQR